MLKKLHFSYLEASLIMMMMIIMTMMIIIMMMIITMMMIIKMIMIIIMTMIIMKQGLSQKIFKDLKIKQLKHRVTDFERWEKCEKQKGK